MRITSPRTPVAPAAAQPADMRDLVTELDLWSAGVIDSIDPTSVSLHYYTGPYDSAGPLLSELGFAASTLDRIRDTQIADGTQTAESPAATASWSLDDDEGLSLVIALTG